MSLMKNCIECEKPVDWEESITTIRDCLEGEDDYAKPMEAFTERQQTLLEGSLCGSCYESDPLK